MIWRHGSNSKQLGTPTWWKELGAVPGIEDRHKFAWKIRASFYVPEVQLRASPEEGYTAPPAPAFWIEVLSIWKHLPIRM